MKTTIQQQIIAIQDVRHIVNKVSLTGESGFDLSRLMEIDKALNDAGSTLAAINFNPEIKKLLEL
jgi:hypothetical protein